MKTRYIYIILIIFIYVGNYSAQSSIKNKYVLSIQRQEGGVLREKIVRNLKVAESIFNDSIEQSLLIIEESLLIAIENNFREEEGLVYVSLGGFNQQLQNFELAISRVH